MAMPVETLDIEILFSAGLDCRNDGICEIIILLTRMGHSYTEKEYACGIAILQASTFEAGRSGGMGTLRPETKDGEEEEVSLKVDTSCDSKRLINFHAIRGE